MKKIDRLSDIGPQGANEHGMAARIRFHQSWYRLNVLQLTRYGRSQPHTGGRQMGSILHDEDAAAGKNFMSCASERHYHLRRSAGWGVDPIRCTAYMTSSQALTFNFMAPLAEDFAWASRTLSALLSINIESVTKIQIEHAPRQRSLHLGDMTMLDCWIEAESQEGPLGIAFEIKYADRFNSRNLNVSDNPKYRSLAEHTGLWSLDSSEAKLRAVNQLIRCHALAASMWTKRHGRASLPMLAIIHHPADRSALKVTTLYQSALQIPNLLRVFDLDQLFEAMRLNAQCQQQADLAGHLRTRYVDHIASDEDWKKYQESK